MATLQALDHLHMEYYRLCLASVPMIQPYACDAEPEDQSTLEDRGYFSGTWTRIEMLSHFSDCMTIARVQRSPSSFHYPAMCMLVSSADTPIYRNLGVTCLKIMAMPQALTTFSWNDTLQVVFHWP